MQFTRGAMSSACTSYITANFFHIHHITIQYENTFSHLFTLSTFTLSYDTMSYETTFHTTLYQYDIHIIVSRKNVSYDSHLHFVQSWGWICAVSVKTNDSHSKRMVLLYNIFVYVVSVYSVHIAVLHRIAIQVLYETLFYMIIWLPGVYVAGRMPGCAAFILSDALAECTVFLLFPRLVYIVQARFNTLPMLCDNLEFILRENADF